MTQSILSEVEQFIAETGLSEHRAGIVLARNGRLVERLRDPKRRVWPETIENIRTAIASERRRRGLPSEDAA